MCKVTTEDIYFCLGIWICDKKYFEYGMNKVAVWSIPSWFKTEHWTVETVYLFMFLDLWIQFVF